MLPKPFQPHYLAYADTNFSTKIILDYIGQAEELKSFFLHTPSLDGIKEAIIQRQGFSTDRSLLVSVLKKQYAALETSGLVIKNIELLGRQDTFTICTAHQPNIFTGHLYFIYKILHTIKLAAYLNEHLPENKFVPVFYMGSEDADLEELGHIYLRGEKYDWKTQQTGAVGKMLVDEHLIKLIDEMSGQIAILPYGAPLMELIKTCYTRSIPIQDATLKLINNLFAGYGLIVLIPDSADLKRTMHAVFEDDIFNGTAHKIVAETLEKLSRHYNVQAYPRDINLFYLKENIRSRIIAQGDNYYIEDSAINFTAEEMSGELTAHPERFSPNVILRGLYQENILPNLAFVGGGGELAYWLELKDLFQHYKVPYPVLLLRNSFMLIDNSMKSLYDKLQFDLPDLFKEEFGLVNELVKRESTHQLLLTLEKQQVAEVYDDIKKVAEQIDSTLMPHTQALRTNALNKINALEKKMLKAEKIKFEVQKKQIARLKSKLFPHGQLQERVDNFLPYYALYDKGFLDVLYEHSLVFQAKFCVLTGMETSAADNADTM